MSHDTSTDLPGLRADAALDPEIRPLTSAGDATSAPRTALLTGATGFVGAHIVNALCDQGVERVFCLTRASSDGEAKERVVANLRKYGIANPRAEAAVEGVSGDSSADRCGLDRPRFEDLAGRTDVVVHNGAWVHLGKTYEELRPTNVWGTRELIRLACTGKPKPLCHISGMSVFLDAERMTEDEPPPPAGRSHGGYFDTKWVSECLVWEAYRRGVRGRVVRLGWISGDSKLGLIPDSDATTIFIRACVRLGAAPQLAFGAFECTPVDLAARVIAHAALEPTPSAQGCNLWSTHRFTQEALWQRFGAEGNPVAVVPFDEWVERLRKRFPLLEPIATMVTNQWNYPPREDTVAAHFVRRAGGVPAIDELLSVYVPALLKRRPGAARPALRERPSP